MARGQDIECIDIAAGAPVSLTPYDIIGFASGIYGFTFHPSVAAFAKQHLPQGKKVFFVYTYGVAKGKGASELVKIAQERDAALLGEYSCKGYDTFGPFKLVGGAAKGHPTAQELEQARTFYHSLLEKCGAC